MQSPRNFRAATVLTMAFSLILFLLASSAQAAPRKSDVLNLDSPPLVIEVGGPGLGDYENTKTYARKVNLLQGQSGYLDYSVEGPIPATLSVEMVDLGVDAGGNKIPVPLNSTKFGLRGIVKPVLSKTTYIPNGKKQNYRVKLTNLVGSLEGVRLGGVKVNLIPRESAKPGSKTINMVSAIVVSVGAIQYGFDMNEFNAQAKIRGSDLRFDPVRRSGILGLIDYIPDIPFIIDHGPADWSLSIVNVGIQPIEQFMRWRIVKGRNIPYTDDLKKYSFIYASEGGSHLTIPDQKFRESTRTVLVKNTEVQSDLRAYAKPTEINALPLFGIITADAQVHTSFGAFKGKTQHFSKTYLIFPWKEVMLIIFAFLGYRKARRKIKKARKERAERKLAEAELAASEAMASLAPDQPTPGKRAVARRPAAKKAVPKKSTNKKVEKKSPAKKTVVRKIAKKAPVKKPAVKKPAVKKPDKR